VEAAGVFDEWSYNTLPSKNEEAEEDDGQKASTREKLGF
jgi:hypothetical protein